MIRLWLDALAPRDLLIPRRVLALVYIVAFTSLATSTVIGFLGGYLLSGTEHAQERASALTEYARQLDVKDARINTLTRQIIDAQDAMARRAARTDEMITGVLLALEHLSANIAGNRANTKELGAAIQELRRLRVPSTPPPSQARPEIGPPPQAPLAPRPDLKLVPKPSPTPRPNLYLGQLT